MHEIRITFVLDTICPFTYLARRKLQLAMAQITSKEAQTGENGGDSTLPVTFRIDYRPFQIAKHLRDTPISKREWYIKEKFHGDAQAQAEMERKMQALAQQVGIALSYDGVIRNSIPAHRLICLLQHERDERDKSGKNGSGEGGGGGGGGDNEGKPAVVDVELFLNALYRLYFEEAQDPASNETLLAAYATAAQSTTTDTNPDASTSASASTSGGTADLARISAFLASDAMHDTVTEQITEQNMNGVDGVPTLMVEGRRRDFTVVGAKEVEEYVAVFRQVVKEL